MDRLFMSDQQFARLPRYAQLEIERLERDLADARAKLAAGPAASNTFADWLSDTPRPLGTGTRVRFGDFTARLADGELEVTASTSGTRRLAIVPRVSNSFTAALVERG